MLTIALSRPSVGLAATPSSVDLDREIGALVEQQKYREAAVRLEVELKKLSEMHDNRVRRNELASRAVNAYTEAFRATPDDCALASSGLVIADEYLQELLSVYGAGASHSDEYTGMSALQAELDHARTERNCPAPAKSSTANDLPPDPGPTTLQPQTDTSRRADRPLVIGLAVSAAMTGSALAVSLGTGLSRYKEPFRGAAYKNIYDTAVASHSDGLDGNEVNYGKGNDMCADARAPLGVSVVNPLVADSCTRWDNLGKVAIGTGIVAGLFGVTTIALAVALAIKRRNASNAAALLHRHQAAFGVSPAWRGGFHASLGFSF